MANPTTYWAAEEGAPLASELYRRVDDKYASFLSLSYYQRLLRLYSYYFGVTYEANSFALAPGGDVGELTLTHVNKLRVNVQHLLSMLTSRKILFSAVPKDSSAGAAHAQDLAEKFLNGEVRELRLNRAVKMAVEHALIGNEGWCFVTWNSRAGEPVGEDEFGNMIYEGRNQTKVYSIFDITRDETVPYGCVQWVIVRDYVNKFDLAAEFPEHEQAILAKSPDTFSPYYLGFWQRNYSTSETDLIPVYTFYHEKSSAMPEGKQCRFIDGNTILTCGPLGYDKIPGYRFTPSDILGLNIGYSPVNDMMGAQDGLNLMVSTLLSNAAAYGVQNLQTRPGAIPNKEALGSGMNLFITNAPIEPMTPPTTPPEIANMMGYFENVLETQLGLNKVAIGNVDPSSRLSLQSLSMLKQQSLEFSSGPQERLMAFIEDIGTGLIENMKVYATEERNARLIDKDGSMQVGSVSGQTFEAIDKVTIEVGNELLETAQSRFYAGELMANANMFDSPAAYVRFIKDGNILAAVDTKFNADVAIQAKKEALLRGQPPLPIMTDDHVPLIRAYKSILDMPEIQNNQPLMEMVMNQIMQQLDVAAQTPPALSAVLGHTPVDASAVPVPVQGQGQAPPQAAPQAPPPGAPPPGAPPKPSTP